uniref:Uncharacterized protein n=1 Tax=Utricularia reniformis TaxID=192314 RepID=A0A1Y0B3F3_9LAMI|nr:hypothetical protein AEK19_MT1728 [Utricularia reniformis]ART31907.1 hypothetical protein AEK19_MT1728 [Utricularia reniformis]
MLSKLERIFLISRLDGLKTLSQRSVESIEAALPTCCFLRYKAYHQIQCEVKRFADGKQD